MTRTRKRSLGWRLLGGALLAVTAFAAAGCSSSSTSSTAASSSANSKASTTANSAAKVTLVVYSAQGYDSAMTKAFTQATGIPVKLVDQHVDAVRAITREYARDNLASVAGTLTRRLRDVTDDFLRAENAGRPDYLESIFTPTLAP